MIGDITMKPVGKQMRKTLLFVLALAACQPVPPAEDGPPALAVLSPNPTADWQVAMLKGHEGRGGSAYRMSGYEHHLVHEAPVSPAPLPALARVEPPIAVSVAPPLAAPGGDEDLRDWLIAMGRYCQGEVLSEPEWRVIEAHGGPKNLPSTYKGRCSPVK